MTNRKTRMPFTPRAHLQKHVRGSPRDLLVSAFCLLPLLFVLFIPVHLEEREVCHTEKKKESEKERVPAL